LSQSQKLHVLFFSSWYPNRKNPLLGIFVKRHAQAVALFHDVTLLHAVADDDMKVGEFRIEKIESNNLREVIVHFGRNAKLKGWRRSLNNLNLLKKHYRFGAQKVLEWYGKPDIAHLNVPWPIGLIALSICKKWNIPMGLTEHWTGYQPEDGRYKGYVLKTLTKKVVKKAAFVAPVSEQLQKAMQTHGLKGNYSVVANVVDTDLFKPSENKPEHIKLLHVSVLDDAQKNVSGLLRAFKNVHLKFPPVELIIVGDGPDETSIKRLSNELGLTFRGVTFVGKLEGLSLAEAYRDASALVLNSRYENQPVVMLEALASGIPVIAPAIGGIPEVLNESNGILFESGTDLNTEKGILEWLEKHDSYNRDTIRREAIKKFSYASVGQQLSSLYLKALGRC
jgi:L-malate glycosyltransferase